MLALRPFGSISIFPNPKSHLFVDLEGQTPIAILRADANAASREVSMLDFTNTEATRLAQALIVHSCLSRISQPFNPPPPPPQVRSPATTMTFTRSIP